MRVAHRRPRIARPSRLEALEGRALLASGLVPLEALHISTPISFDLSSAEPETTTSETPSVTLLDVDLTVADATMPSSDPLRVSMSFPWRVTSWLRSKGSEPDHRADIPQKDHPAFDSLESARILSSLQQIRMKGELVPGAQGHFYGLPVTPGIRALRFSYEVPIGDWSDRAPLRVWLTDAEGKAIDSWWLDSREDRLDVHVLALVPPGSTMLYVGIEAVGAPVALDSPIAYLLEVQQAQPSSPRPFPSPGSSQVEVPSIGADLPHWGGLGPGGPARMGSIHLSGALMGSGPGFSTADSFAGGGVVVQNAEGLSSIPVSFGNGLVRPLPIQSASTVGGLLPAGPAVRGDGNAPDRVSRFDELTDPLLLAAEPVEPGTLGEGDANGFDGPGSAVGRWSDPAMLADLDALPIESAPDPQGISRLAGPGGLPMLVAGLRLAKGKPSILATGSALPEVPDDLAVLVADPVPAPSPRPLEESPQQFESDAEADPTRPRVLRTALIGAAALAVGLLLPDVTSDRPLVRDRLAPNFRNLWRCLRGPNR